MCALARETFDPPFAGVSMPQWENIVLDTWQTEKWFEPLAVLITGRLKNIASSLRRRMLTDAGEMQKPHDSQIFQNVEEGISSVWNINTESIAYRAHWRKVNASFATLEAARGWRLLAKRYELEGRSPVEVPREEWHIEMLESLGREYNKPVIDQGKLFD